MGQDWSRLALLRGTFAVLALAISSFASYVWAEALGIRFLVQGVAQEYDFADLLIVFCGTALIWRGLVTTWRLWRTGRVTKLDGFALMILFGLACYFYVPEDEYTFFAFAFVGTGPARSYLLDVTFLLATVAAVPGAAIMHRHLRTRRRQAPVA